MMMPILVKSDDVRKVRGSPRASLLALGQLVSIMAEDL